MRLRNPLLLFLAAAFLLAAAERPFARVEGDALTSHTFQLHYRENFGLAFLHIRILSHPSAFPKEPPLGNAEVFRGIIWLPKHSGPSIALIGDKTQRRLYNRGTQYRLLLLSRCIPSFRFSDMPPPRASDSSGYPRP
jgi:hypothetical protein